MSKKKSIIFVLENNLKLLMTKEQKKTIDYEFHNEIYYL